MTPEYKDYYATLGVAKNATAGEIQKAFRSLARKYHPDLNKDSDAEDRFKEINEAYEVLGDAEKRKLYDELGANWQAGGSFRGSSEAEEFLRRFRGGGTDRDQYGSFSSFGAGGTGEGADAGGYSDFFSFLFGNQGPFFDSSSTRRTSPEKQSPLQADVDVSLEDCALGAEKEYQFDFVRVDPNGSRIKERRKFRVRIPVGSRDGTKVRLKGQGGSHGVSRDLVLKLRVLPHERFFFEGGKLVTYLDVTPWEAALGARVPLKTLGGDVVVTVAPNSQAGRMLRIRGKGLPARAGEPQDLFAKIRICIPEALTSEEVQLFEKLREISSFDPRR